MNSLFSQNNSNSNKINIYNFIKRYQVNNIPTFKSYLLYIWKELTIRSENKKGINKFTFAKYYELPGIILDRVFNIFANNNNKFIESNDFVENMLILFSSNYEEIILFIFRLYDFDKDNKISKEDIRIVLSYIPLNIPELSNLNPNIEFEYRIESQIELHNKLDLIFEKNEKINFNQFVNIIENQNSDIFLFILILLYEKRPFNKKTVQVLDNIDKTYKKNDISNNNNNNNKLIITPSLNSIFKPSLKFNNNYGTYIVDSLFDFKHKDNIDKGNSFSSTEFKKVGRKKISKNVSFKKYHKESNDNNFTDDTNIQTNNIKFEDIKRDSSNINKSISSIDKFSDGEYFYDSSGEDDELYIDEKDKENFYGHIYKVINGKKYKKFWFCLYYKDLFYYKSKNEQIFLGMHNLTGVFIREEQEKKVKKHHFYCFSIVSPEKTRYYYIEDKKEYEEWLINLRKAIGDRKLTDKYEVKKIMSNGKFGILKKGINKITKKEVVISILAKEDMNTLDLEQVINEISILKIIKHPYIGTFYDVYENIDFIYLIKEYYKGGDLNSYFQKRNYKLKENQVAEIIRQLSSVIYFLEEYGIIHRDLKPENILMTDDTDKINIKLLDFFSGLFLGPGTYYGYGIGTLPYAAPEFLESKPIDKSVDIWSIGIITYYLLTGILPFDDINGDYKVIEDKIINSNVIYPEKYWNSISLDAKNFVMSILKKNPQDRINIKDILNHPWIQKYSNSPLQLCQCKIDINNMNMKINDGEIFKFYSAPSIKFLKLKNKFNPDDNCILLNEDISDKKSDKSNNSSSNENIYIIPSKRKSMKCSLFSNFKLNIEKNTNNSYDLSKKKKNHSSNSSNNGENVNLNKKRITNSTKNVFSLFNNKNEWEIIKITENKENISNDNNTIY